MESPTGQPEKPDNLNFFFKQAGSAVTVCNKYLCLNLSTTPDLKLEAD